MTDALPLPFSLNAPISSLRPSHEPVVLDSLSTQPAVVDFDQFAQFLGSFLDLAATSMKRGSFYNSQDDISKREEQLHQALISVDRGLYGLTLTLPGTTDFSRQRGICFLLAGANKSASRLLTVDEEKRVLEALVSSLKPTRLLKVFLQLKELKVNNARTRRLMLRSILSQKKLELWSTRYRQKLRLILTHAWGQRMTSILRSILSKAPGQRTEKEKGLLNKHILRYRGKQSAVKAFQCVSFILGIEEGLTLPLLTAYVSAKQNLEAGSALSYETLEGLRSQFHKDQSSERVLELTAKNLTKGQKLVLQSKAEVAKVKVELKPEDYDAVKLYLYAFKRGMSPEIEKALNKRAKELAASLKLPYRKVAIVLDASGSMAGHETQPLRPMAVSLALRDGLEQAAADSLTIVAGGGEALSGARLIQPEGGTALASALLEAMKGQPDAVFVLSDGYENSPAGRTAEVLKALRNLGYEAPVFQLSSVFAAETGALRELAPGLMGTLPVSNPERLGVTMFKAMLKADSLRALQLFVNQALENIGVQEALPTSETLENSIVRNA